MPVEGDGISGWVCSPEILGYGQLPDVFWRESMVAG